MPDLKSIDALGDGMEMRGRYNQGFAGDNDGSTQTANGTKYQISVEEPAADYDTQVSRTQELAGTKTDDTHLVYMQEDFEDLIIDQGPCMAGVSNIQSKIETFFSNYGHIVRYVVYAILLAGYTAYFAYAMYHEQLSVLESITLLWVTCLAVFIVVVSAIRDKWGSSIYDSFWGPVVNFIEGRWTLFKVLFCIVVIAGFATIMGLIAVDSPYNLVSLAGGVALISLGFVFSANPGMVRWRVIFWGLGLQFTFALLVLRTVWGYEAFRWLGDLILAIINFVEAGVTFVFGEEYATFFFAFRVMPVIVYLCAVIAILYHWGVVQVVVEKFGWLMEICVGTTAGESTAAAANVFLGQNESPMLIAPLLGRMTDSEIHCVMTGGFATIAGSVMATFIALGVPANHIISASIISAPCTLAISKLFKPETKKTKFASGEKIEFENKNYRNAFDAACQGAIDGVTIVACIMGNLIAFLSMLALLNGLLTWLGNRVGLMDPPLTFELICSYLLWPVAFCLGVPVEDCYNVAELLGIKMFVNEFVSYLQLISLIENGDTLRDHIAANGSCFQEGRDIHLYWDEPTGNDTILVRGVMHPRSEVICTYALCGFANIGSIGIQLGMFTTLVPGKVNAISGYIFRAMLAGTLTSYLTACTAGLLYDPTIEERGHVVYNCL